MHGIQSGLIYLLVYRFSIGLCIHRSTGNRKVLE
jgi:hypothetical protein